MRQFAVAAVLVAVVAAAGCGGSSSSSSSAPKGKPDPAAANTAQRYVDAYMHKKAPLICNLVASSVVQQMHGHRGCLKQVRASFTQGIFPKLHVKQALASGSTATATFTDSPRQVTLTKDAGGWKVINGG